MTKLCKHCGCAMPRLAIETHHGHCIVQRCRGCGEIERISQYFNEQGMAEAAMRLLHARETLELFKEVKA